MKTIPASWKPGGTSDRNLWYNNIGTSLIWVRIQSATQTIRLSNERLKLDEGAEFGWAEYDDRFFDEMGNIDTALTFLKGKAGAVGQMGQVDLVLRNYAQDGLVFSDEYDMDSFANANIDVWYCPKECGTFDMDNVHQLFKGVLTNVVESPNVITMTINEYSNTKHKKIPMRQDEFNEEQSMSWTVPEGNVAKIVPICFGTGIFKAIHCDTIDNGTRYYFINYDYKNIRTTYKTVLYYWEGSEKRFKVVDNAKWSEHDYLGTDLQLIKFDVAQLAIYQEMANYLIPSAVAVSCHYGQPLALNGDKLADKKKATTADASNTRARDVSGGFEEDVWQLVYTLTFKKTQFDLRGNFDLYAVSQITYEHAGVKRWESKFGWKAIEKTQDETMFDEDGSLHYCAWIPTEWINEGYAPNESITVGLFKKNVSPSELNDNNLIAVSLKPLTNPITTREAYVYEVSLMQVMLSLPKDFYVLDDFGNNAIKDAISYLFTNFLNIASANILYENFQKDYKIDGQINEEIDSYELFGKLAEDFGIIYYEDEDGKEHFIDIAPDDTVYEITDDDIISSGKVPQIEKYRTEIDVFSAFFVDYRKHYATGEYDASKYVTKDNHNLGHIDSSLMKALCQDAYDYYGTEKRLSVKLDMVRDTETAEEILGKLVQFYSRKRVIIKLTSTMRLEDLQIGDQVRINTTFFSHSNNFYVAGKSINTKTWRIEFILFEAPWSGSGITKTISEMLEIDEDYTVIKLISKDETLQVLESEFHTKV